MHVYEVYAVVGAHLGGTRNTYQGGGAVSGARITVKSVAEFSES
jgi:hypothetical protein